MAKRISPFISLDLKESDEYHHKLDKHETRRANIRDGAIITAGALFFLLLTGHAAYRGTLPEILGKVLVGVLLMITFALINFGFRWFLNQIRR